MLNSKSDELIAEVSAQLAYWGACAGDGTEWLNCARKFVLEVSAMSGSRASTRGWRLAYSSLFDLCLELRRILKDRGVESHRHESGWACKQLLAATAPETW